MPFTVDLAVGTAAAHDTMTSNGNSRILGLSTLSLAIGSIQRCTALGWFVPPLSRWEA